MAESRYGRYVITEPRLITELAHHDFTEVSGITFPDEVYLDRELLEEANQWLDIMWIWEIPNPPGLLGAHSHPFDEVVLLIGSNPRDARDFGGEIEWWMGDRARGRAIHHRQDDPDIRAKGLVTRADELPPHRQAGPQRSHRPEQRRFPVRATPAT